MLMHGDKGGRGRTIHRILVDRTSLFPYVYMAQVEWTHIATMSDKDLVPLAELLIVAYRDRLKRDRFFRDSYERRVLNAMLNLDGADLDATAAKPESGKES